MLEAGHQVQPTLEQKGFHKHTEVKIAGPPWRPPTVCTAYGNLRVLGELVTAPHS